jgi:hypothetical protein
MWLPVVIFMLVSIFAAVVVTLLIRKRRNQSAEAPTEASTEAPVTSAVEKRVSLVFSVVVAAHSNSPQRHAALQSVLNAVQPHASSIIVVDSEGLPRPACCTDNVQYLQVPNDPCRLDMAKWQHGLAFITDETDVVVTVNDSCLVVHNIDDFFLLMQRDRGRSELYGYVESCQGQMHYQSMCRAFNRKGVTTFREHLDQKLKDMGSMLQLIQEFEVRGFHRFKSRQCLHPVQPGPNRHYTPSCIADNYDRGYALLKLKAMFQPELPHRALENRPFDDFESIVYKKLNRDLSGLPDDACWGHFVQYGQYEMRPYRANQPRKLLECLRERLPPALLQVFTEGGDP